ncbi:MAG: DUF1822 family protein [Cyanobacteria bacterium J06643_5]
MDLLELFPEVAAWNIDKLIDDINAIRKRLDNKGNISQMHEYYLSGTLVGHKPNKICQILNLNGDGKSIRTAISTEINPYIKELLEYPSDLEGNMNWQRACVLLENAGYKKTKFLSEQDSATIKIKLDSQSPSMADIQIILDKIHEMTQDKSIEIQDIRRGCIELVLSGSEEGLKRLESLVNSGELTELNGVKIINVESLVESNKVVRLSNWLDNLVESGWQALEQFLNPQQLQFENIRSGDITKAKLIDRTMLSDGFAVVLTLKQQPLADDSVDIILRIYPTQEQAHLPSDIKLRMFCKDEDGNQVSRVMQANSSDRWIQLSFIGQPKEEFTVEIVKGDVSVVENFVI